MSDVGVERVCTFQVGEHVYGIDVQIVREVLIDPRITPVPLTPPAVIGVMNLRGQIVTVIDLGRRLELPPRREDSEAVSVVIEADGELVSLLVDRAGDVLDVRDVLFEPPPETLKGPARDLLLGAYSHPSGLVLLLDAVQAAAPEASPAVREGA